MRNIRQNLVFAFGYNALGIPVAAGVLDPAFGLLLSPVFAGAAQSRLLRRVLPLFTLERLHKCNAGVRFMSVPRLHDADWLNCSRTAIDTYPGGLHNNH